MKAVWALPTHLAEKSHFLMGVALKRVCPHLTQQAQASGQAMKEASCPQLS